MVKWAEFYGVSTSGYYTWEKELSDRNKRDKDYREEVKKAFDSGEEFEYLW